MNNIPTFKKIVYFLIHNFVYVIGVNSAGYIFINFQLHFIFVRESLPKSVCFIYFVCFFLQGIIGGTSWAGLEISLQTCIIN